MGRDSKRIYDYKYPYWQSPVPQLLLGSNITLSERLLILSSFQCQTLVLLKNIQKRAES